MKTKRRGFFAVIGGGIAAMFGIKYIPVKAVITTVEVPTFLIGTVVRSTAYPGNGWQLCNGAMLRIKDYPKLFESLGPVYGSSKDGTWFNIPDWRMWNLHGDGTSTETSEHWIKVE